MHATPPSPDAACPVCLETRAATRLAPCAHELCLRCALSLPAAACPLCRAPVAAVAAAGAPSARALAPLLAAREARDARDLSAVRQVVVAGPPAVGKAALVARLCAMYPLPADVRDRCDEGGPGLRPTEPEAAEAILDAAGVRRRFVANACVHGVPTRFSVIRLPDLTHCGATAAVLTELTRMRPHFLLMTASQRSRASFDLLMHWDRRVVSGFGGGVWGQAGAPPRFWVMLRGVPTSPDAALVTDDCVDERTDIGVAMAALPVASRPKTSIRLSIATKENKPKSPRAVWLRGVFSGRKEGLRIVAERALFYAASYEPLLLEGSDVAISVAGARESGESAHCVAVESLR